MDKLKCKIKRIIHVDYSDFERFVNNVYFDGKYKYEFGPDMESSNDTTHEFTVAKGENKDEWRKKDLANFKTGENKYVFGWRAGMILNDLCDKGLIKSGDYFIRISW